MQLRHIHKVRKKLANGATRVYYYHRRTKLKIEADPADPEKFAQAYAKAAARPTGSIATFAGLIDAFMASAWFTSRALKTRKDYERYLAKLKAKFGKMPTGALNDHRIRGDFFRWRDTMSDTPRTADYSMQVARRVLAWAYDSGEIEWNHLGRVRLLYESDRSDKIWHPEHIARFCKVAYPELQHALWFGLYTLQREGDVLAMGPQHVRDWRFKIKQRKTGVWAEGPILDELRKIIESLPTDRMVFLASRNGQQWKPDHFRHEWRAACLAAGIHDLHFHDLRGTGITRLVVGGWSAGPLALMAGLSVTEASRIVESYVSRAALTNTNVAPLAAPERAKNGPVNHGVNRARTTRAK